jgi:photosystem II stability/assembly factor-like uncharacterized protein
MSDAEHKRSIKLMLNGPKHDIQWPVTTGIPFAKAMAAADTPMKLLDPYGQDMPCDTRPHVLWPDGSIRWLTINTVTSMKNSGKSYTLCIGRSQQCPAKQIELDQRIGSLFVRTGDFSMVIPHQQPFAVGTIRLGDRELLPRCLESTVEEVDGAIHTQTIPELMDIEHLSPMKMQIRLEGIYEGEPYAYAYRYRISLYSGLPLIRVEHTITNRCPYPGDRHLRNVNLILHLSERVPEIQFSPGPGSIIHQCDADEYILDGVLCKGRYDGTVSIPSCVSFCIADFWQKFPKSIKISENTLMINLLDDTSQQGMTMAQGEAQTNEIWFWFGPGAPSSDHMASLVNQRPILHSSPQAMCSSGVLGELQPYDSPANLRYENGVEKGLQTILGHREEKCEYGYRDYGDTRYEMLSEAWLNGEYDWAHAYFLHFARTGDRRYLDLAISFARHMMDTDIIHYKTSPYDHLIGAPHSHSTNHTAGDVDIGHAWVEGLFDISVLLDDTKAWEHATSMADFFLRCVCRLTPPKYRDRPGARRPGWGLIALTYAYEHTRETRYLDAARKIVEICEIEQEDNGSWVYPGGGLDDPGYLVGKTFMVALTLVGLMRYHRMTGTESVQSVFLKGVAWAVDAMWDENVGGFRYIDAPFDSFQRSPGSSAGYLLEPLWYAYKLTGDLRYSYVASRTWCAWLEHNQDLTLMPSEIRDVVHYLPHHHDKVDYKGSFPLYSLRPPEPKHIRRFYFFPNGHGFAVGLFGLMLATEDWGQSWRRIDTNRTEHLYAIDFTSDERGFALGEGTAMLKTKDGGRTWSSHRSLRLALRGASLHYFYDLVMVDDRTGYAGGYAVVAKTDDAGNTWSRIWDAVGDSRWDKLPQWRSLSALSSSCIWGVGSYNLSATIEKSGKTVVPRPGAGFNNLHVTFINDEVGFTSDANGTIRKTVDEGKSWSVVGEFPENAIWQTAFRNEAVGFACGENGILLVSKNDGDSWSKIETNVSTALRAVAVFNDRVALAGGDDGVLLRTEDGGKTWNRITYSY